MGGWIGTLGNLVEFKCPSRLSVSQARERTWFTGLDSTDIVFEATGFAQRTWQLDLSTATPQDLVVFDLIQARGLGLGPFKFVTPWSSRTNLLTPAMSVMGGLASPYNVTSAQVVVPQFGAVAGGSTRANSTARFGVGTPVIPGTPVTVSAWVVSSQTITVTAQCMDAGGAWTHNTKQVYDGLVSGGWVAVTITPNAASAQVDLRIDSPGVDLVACPAITWTPQRMPWAPAAGVSGVVIDSHDTAVVRATTDQRLADIGVTLVEVRDA